MATAQLGLFDVVLPADRQRRRDALVCLRDVMSDALEVVVELRNPRAQDSRSPLAAGDWAFCVTNAGLRFEAATEWWHGAYERGETWGWSRTPAQLVTWAELTELIGHDPRRAEVASWVASLPQPRWRPLVRPKEMGPDPGGWHISYLCHDHVDEHWPARRRAWQLVLDLLNDAISRITMQDQWVLTSPDR
jgi:hypothetical protein